MTSQQGEVLRIVRELEFDHHSNLVLSLRCVGWDKMKLEQSGIAIQVLSIL